MIKTGVYLSDDCSAQLIRLLVKHPDVEIMWILLPENCRGACDVLSELQGEIAGIPVFNDGVDQIDYSSLDLYIGEPVESFKEYFEGNDSVKMIGSGDIQGVCELNRKAMVRGGRAVTTPDTITLLGALALMPLAKNLMLNGVVTGVMLLPGESRKHACYCIPPDGLSAGGLRVLRDEILPSLQTSFNSPVEISCIESYESTFACAILTVDFKITAGQALDIYRNYYEDHRHVFFPEKSITDSMVMGTNKTAVCLRNDSLGRLVVSVGFDARYKAGAGNIVHILNLLFGLDERTGL